MLLCRILLCALLGCLFTTCWGLGFQQYRYSPHAYTVSIEPGLLCRHTWHSYIMPSSILTRALVGNLATSASSCARAITKLCRSSAAVKTCSRTSHIPLPSCANQDDSARLTGSRETLNRRGWPRHPCCGWKISDHLSTGRKGKTHASVRMCSQRALPFRGVSPTNWART